MFREYFGIEENPFSNTPDPSYLFLSERHQEALAHLQYGINGTSGFVLLTGEVGTGKTTVSRCLVEQLPDNIDLAMCLNPRLSEAELLATVCDELAIDRSVCASGSIKDHMDALNQRLLECHAEGRRAVLIIDEAQNLSTGLLEQVRLLTNLETASTKLLQIILIGQPELRDILSRKDMRQLSQRITARYHLDPMTRPEADNYIRHRVGVGKLPEDVIQAGAFSVIYDHSGGVPRLINSICERSLLGAYATNQKTIDAALAHAAAREVLGGPSSQDPTRRGGTGLAAVNGAVAAALAASLVFGSVTLALSDRDGRRAFAENLSRPAHETIMNQTALKEAALKTEPKAKPLAKPAKKEPPMPARKAASAAQAPVRTETKVDTADEALKAVSRLIADGLVATPAPDTSPPKASKAKAPEEKNNPPATEIGTETRTASLTTESKPAPGLAAPAQDLASPAEKLSLDTLFRQSVIKGDLGRAVSRLFRLWDRDAGALSALNPCADAKAQGLRCYQTRGPWSKLVATNHPALISLGKADGETRKYAVVTRLEGTKVTLELDGQSITAEAATVQGLWSGEFMVLWRTLPDLRRTLRPGMSGKDVAWLRARLEDIQKTGESVDNEKDGHFGAVLKKRVVAFQKDRGLEPDGIIGTLTRMHLSAVTASSDAPALRKQP